MYKLKQKMSFYLYSVVNKCPAVMHEDLHNFKTRSSDNHIKFILTTYILRILWQIPSLIAKLRRPKGPPNGYQNKLIITTDGGIFTCGMSQLISLNYKVLQIKASFSLVVHEDVYERKIDWEL